MAIDLLQDNGTEQPFVDLGPTTDNGAGSYESILSAIRQFYQQYLGRDAGPGEAESWVQSGQSLADIENGIKSSAEASAHATATTAANAGGSSGPTPAGAFNKDALRAALLAYGAPASADELKKFIAAHPEFATGVTVGGSKGNKLYGPGGQFLADVIRGTSGTSPAWDWDESIGTSGGGTAVDPSYLAPYTGTFADTWRQLYGSDFDPSSGPAFAAPGGMPEIDVNALANDPGFKFRRDQAMGALQNTAAARGVLNSGGTLYDLLGLGDQMASQEFGDAWNRNFSKWNADWTHALGAFGANKGVADDDYNRAWQQYVENKDTWFRNQDSAFDKLYKAGSLGASAASA